MQACAALPKGRAATITTSIMAARILATRPCIVQTTSYDYDAQISETGRLSDKWRACKRVALFAQTFRDILLTGTHTPAPDKGVGKYGFRITETKTAQKGGIVWIDNPD